MDKRKFAKQLKADSRQAFLAPDGRVYVLRRVSTMDLIKHKWLEVQAARDAQAALDGVEKDQRADFDREQLQKVKDPEERKELEGKLKRQHEHNVALALQKAEDSITRSPESLAQYFARVHAYVCASVVGGADPSPGDVVGAVSMPARDKVFDLRFCLDEADEHLPDENDDRPVVMWVETLDEGTRAWLCAAASTLSASPVSAFRVGSSDSRGAGSDGSSVRAPTQPTAEG